MTALALIGAFLAGVLATIGAGFVVLWVVLGQFEADRPVAPAEHLAYADGPRLVSEPALERRGTW